MDSNRFIFTNNLIGCCLFQKHKYILSIFDAQMRIYRNAACTVFHSFKRSWESDSLLLVRVGWMLLERKTMNSCLSRSIQKIVPVKPV